MSRGSKERFLDNFDFGIFDMDGTLVDSMPFYTRIFGQVMSGAGIDRRRSERYFVNTTGTPLAAQIKGLLEREPLVDTEIDEDRLWNEFVRLVMSDPPGAMPGAEEVIVEIRRRSIKLFLTSGSDVPEEFLQRIGILHHFRAVLSSREIAKGPQHIHLFAESMGMAVPDFCGQTFLVGDGVADMELAHKMRIYSIGLVGTVSAEELRRAGAEEVIDNLYQLLEI